MRSALLVVLVVAAAWPRSDAAAQASGDALYQVRCAPCHGASGDGQGPARSWLWPPPRDLVRGPYKWSADPAAPSRAELRAVIDHGVRGTSMPAFAELLGEAERELLVDVVQRLAKVRRPKASRAALALPAPPADRAALKASGARLWRERGCAVCHGPTGRGDGPLAAGLFDAAGRASPPYDFSSGLRRPHDPQRPEARREAAARSIAAGLPGTVMGKRELPPAELWALAEHVAELAAPAAAAAPPLMPALAPQAIAADRAAPVVAGAWPGQGDPDALRLFPPEIPAQGAPPATLAPAQASLSSRQCARCHAAQELAWRGSVHAAAYSPGLRAQYGTAALGAEEIVSCQRCHGPLAEQAQARTAERAPPVAERESSALIELERGSAGLASEGVTCSVCHVRGWQRLGPPRPSASLLALPGYPRVEAEVYQRADFCLPCHQLPARYAVSGRPLLDTYREWLLGPYMRRGVQCQHCHMPNREHAFRGIHDSDTVRQALRVQVRAVRQASGELVVTAVLANVGAGHYFPTTPTPAVWLEAQLVGADRAGIAASLRRARIGRHLELRRDGLHEVEDTRVPPGQSRTVSWTLPPTPKAARVRLSVEVRPDDYYEGFYAARLATERQEGARTLYKQALERARASRYWAMSIEQDVVSR